MRDDGLDGHTGVDAVRETSSDLAVAQCWGRTLQSLAWQLTVCWAITLAAWSVDRAFDRAWEYRVESGCSIVPATEPAQLPCNPGKPGPSVQPRIELEWEIEPEGPEKAPDRPALPQLAEPELLPAIWPPATPIELALPDRE